MLKGYEPQSSFGFLKSHFVLFSGLKTSNVNTLFSEIKNLILAESILYPGRNFSLAFTFTIHYFSAFRAQPFTFNTPTLSEFQ